MKRVDRHLDVEVYARLLGEQLRAGGMDEELLAPVVSDVVAHVRATGEDPVEVFGQPADYAEQWVEPLGAGRIVVGVLAGCVGVAGLFSVMGGLFADGTWGSKRGVTRADLVLAGGWALIAVVLPWTVELWYARRAARRAGRRHLSPWVVHAVAVIAVIVAVAWPGDPVGLHDSQAALLTVPRSLLLAGGLLTFPLYLLYAEPPGRWSLPRLSEVQRRWSRWRRDPLRSFLGSPPRR